MKPESSHNLAWEAFRYAAGEMNAAEGEAFEQLLADDQAAREALAEAVELTQAVHVSYEAEPAMPLAALQPGGRYGAWWMGVALGSAACLFIMLGVQQIQQSQRDIVSNEPAVETDVPEKADGALAARWSEIRESQRDYQPWSEVALDDELSADNLTPWSVEEESDQPAAPEWMMAAVSAARGSEGREDDMNMERSVDGPIEQ